MFFIEKTLEDKDEGDKKKMKKKWILLLEVIVIVVVITTFILFILPRTEKEVITQEPVATEELAFPQEPAIPQKEVTEEIATQEPTKEKEAIEVVIRITLDGMIFPQEEIILRERSRDGVTFLNADTKKITIFGDLLPNGQEIDPGDGFGLSAIGRGKYSFWLESQPEKKLVVKVK